MAVGDYATGPEARRRNQTQLAATVHLTPRVHRIRMLGTAVPAPHDASVSRQPGSDPAGSRRGAPPAGFRSFTARPGGASTGSPGSTWPPARRARGVGPGGKGAGPGAEGDQVTGWVITTLEKRIEYASHRFHIMDPDRGHVTIKMSGHPPVGTQIMLNGRIRGPGLLCPARPPGRGRER